MLYLDFILLKLPGIARASSQSVKEIKSGRRDGDVQVS